MTDSDQKDGRMERGFFLVASYVSIGFLRESEIEETLLERFLVNGKLHIPKG